MDDIILLRRIESRIMAVDDCLEWVGTKSKDGYGKVVVGWNEKHQPIRRFAHRTLYELVNGPIEKGVDLDHLCRNHACVDPDHLEPVTRRENVRRGVLPQMMRDKALNMTHCKRGHPYIEANKVITNSMTGAKTCRICRNQYKRDDYLRNKEKINEKRREKYTLAHSAR